MKELFKKYREIILYLFFGVLTTVVGVGTYNICMWASGEFFGVDMSAPESAPYLIAYFAAQIIQWVLAVLLAFYTNKKWVFTDAGEQKGGTWRQLVIFSGGRVGTLVLDIVVTYALTFALKFVINDADPFTLLGIGFTSEFTGKLVAQIMVFISNYLISKLFVFKKKKDA